MHQLEKQIVADILVVDDEKPHADAIAEGLARPGHNTATVYSGEAAITRIKAQHFDVVVTDLCLGGAIDGLAVLDETRTHSPGTEVILITAHSSVDTCRRALQQGAFDYVEKPIDINELRAVVQRAAERTAQERTINELRRQLDAKYDFTAIVAQSPAMLVILDIIHRVAPSDLPVLIQGESGTGKELLAQAIHTHSRRKENRLVVLNCAGLSESILEDELFGHVKGAYTGAVGERKGRFEHADGGTIFLDEVGDMPLAMQAKLLRVLENGELVRLGSNESINVDVRLISATNHDLCELVVNKRFREDLYFRIKGALINLPALRDRREDIPVLIDHFLKDACRRHQKIITALTPESRRMLVAFDWPGNVRQLKNVIENMVVLADPQSADKLTLDDLPPEIRTIAAGETASSAALVGMSIQDAEKQLISNTLKMVNGNREQAAQILGIGERTLYRKIKDYNLRE
ncbi:MAG: sigma-54-dependent Fis family transcriptional regulator [Planctomycetes bacterium]|nr:sigma-54-dependent Fis family transcriptional regulator [Planctomycetota bacterium]